MQVGNRNDRRNDSNRKDLPDRGVRHRISRSLISYWRMPTCGASRLWTTPLLPADFTQPEPANKFAHKSWRDLKILLLSTSQTKNTTNILDRKRAIWLHLKSDSSFLENNEILLPNCCHEGHQGSKSPVFTGFFKPMQLFPLAKWKHTLNFFV